MMTTVAENIRVMRFPHSLLGTQLGRTVTVITLQSAATVVHSTAPFSPADVREISAHGQPVTLLDATLFHDTFARAGRAAFPQARYLAPEGFAKLSGIATETLPPIFPEWRGELEVMRLEGMPKVREHVCLHVPTRTLIVADLVFNFGPSATRWTRFFFRHVSGIRSYPGVSRIFRAMIRDRAAFAQSVRRMLEWDFDRVIVGHGEIIEAGGKDRLAAALAPVISG